MLHIKITALQLLIPAICKKLSISNDLRPLASWEFLYANVSLLEDGKYSFVFMPANNRDVYYFQDLQIFNELAESAACGNAIKSLNVTNARDSSLKYASISSSQEHNYHHAISWLINVPGLIVADGSPVEKEFNRYSEPGFMHSLITDESIGVDTKSIVQFTLTAEYVNEAFVEAVKGSISIPPVAENVSRDNRPESLEVANYINSFNDDSIRNICLEVIAEYFTLYNRLVKHQTRTLEIFQSFEKFCTDKTSYKFTITILKGLLKRLAVQSSELKTTFTDSMTDDTLPYWFQVTFSASTLCLTFYHS